jgi:hypothetical protein
LQALLRLWRTNAANAYSLTVSNGAGGGNFGAGSIVTLTAHPAPSGQIFSQWLGGVASPGLPTTSFIMPAGNATVTATYSNLPQPSITGWQFTGAGNTNLTLIAITAANQLWILQSSTNLTSWINVVTNPATAGGSWQATIPVDPALSHQFFRLTSP